MYSKILIFFLVLMAAVVLPVYAQPIGDIQCGDIVEGEVVAGQSQTGQGPHGEITFDDYRLAVQAGTQLNLTVEPLGNTFNVGLVLVDSGGNDAVIVNEGTSGQPEQFIDYPLGSSNQILRILGMLPEFVGIEGFYYTNSTSYGHAGKYFGAYQIRLGCTLRDGTVIEPGDTLPTNTGGSGGSSSVPAPVFSGTGFPGLAPVDFASAVKLPMIPATPMTGALTPTGGEIMGFQFDASTGDTLDLSLNRISGNLNLGLVVLSADNQVVSYGGLISGDTFSTRLTLPSAGQYTIGVFRIDLLPPANPEATAFQITGTLNP